MCVEKFVAIYFPLKVKSICTIQTAKRVCGLSALLFIVYDSQYVIFVDIIIENKIKRCGLKGVHPKYHQIGNYMDAVLYSFSPFTIMIISNGAIIYKFLIAKWKHRQSASNGESTSQAMSKAASKGTAMLITVSVMFILLTGPAAVSVVLKGFAHPIERLVMNIMQYANHSINGALYCIVGSRFRNELLDTLCCHRVKLPGSGTSRRLTTNPTESNLSLSGTSGVTNTSAMDSSTMANPTTTASLM